MPYKKVGKWEFKKKILIIESFIWRTTELSLNKAETKTYRTKQTVLSQRKKPF